MISAAAGQNLTDVATEFLAEHSAVTAASEVDMLIAAARSKFAAADTRLAASPRVERRVSIDVDGHAMVLQQRVGQSLEEAAANFALKSGLRVVRPRRRARAPSNAWRSHVCLLMMRAWLRTIRRFHAVFAGVLVLRVIRDSARARTRRMFPGCPRAWPSSDSSRKDRNPRLTRRCVVGCIISRN